MIQAFVIEDEPVMAECVALAVESVDITASDGTVTHPHVEVFNDAVTAMEDLREQLPDLILLDVMLTGPDGFTFLNEMISYSDTAKIPVVLITTLDFNGRDLSHYGVVRILNKMTMTPDDIRDAVRACLTGEAGSDPSAEPVGAELTMPAAAQDVPTPAVVSPVAPGETSLAELNRRFAELEANSPKNPHAN